MYCLEMSFFEINDLRTRVIQLERANAQDMNVLSDNVAKKLNVNVYDEAAVFAQVDALVNVAINKVPVLDEERLFKLVDERLNNLKADVTFDDEPINGSIADLKSQLTTIANTVPDVTPINKSIDEHVGRLNSVDAQLASLKSDINQSLGEVRSSIPVVNVDSIVNLAVDKMKAVFAQMFDETAFMSRVNEQIVGLMQPSFDQTAFRLTIDSSVDAKVGTVKDVVDGSITQLTDKMSDLSSLINTNVAELTSKLVTVQASLDESIQASTNDRSTFKNELTELSASVNQLSTLLNTVQGTVTQLTDDSATSQAMLMSAVDDKISAAISQVAVQPTAPLTKSRSRS